MPKVTVQKKELCNVDVETQTTVDVENPELGIYKTKMLQIQPTPSQQVIETKIVEVPISRPRPPLADHETQMSIEEFPNPKPKLSNRDTKMPTPHLPISPKYPTQPTLPNLNVAPPTHSTLKTIPMGLTVRFFFQKFSKFFRIEFWPKICLPS